MNLVKVEGDEDVTQSPLVYVQRVHDEDDMEVVISSRWQQHASAGEQGRSVTQLAAHIISDGRQSSAVSAPHEYFCGEGACAVAQSLSPPFWQAGNVIGNLAASRRRHTADLPISVVEFNNRRTITIAPN